MDYIENAIQGVAVGKLGKTVYAQLRPGADLYRGIVAVVQQQDMKTGLILNITGTLTQTRLSGPGAQTRIDESPGYFELDGLAEVTGTGYFGRTVDTWKSKPSQVEHLKGDPFLHVHLVVNVRGETHCGHLIDGCKVRSLHEKSHFVVVLAEAEGVDLSLHREKESGLRSYPNGLPYYQLTECDSDPVVGEWDPS